MSTQLDHLIQIQPAAAQQLLPQRHYALLQGNTLPGQSQMHFALVLYRTLAFNQPQLLQTLEQWKATYLQAWDQSIDELEPEEGYKQDRRIAIIETFDRMIALAAADEEEGAEEDWGEE